MQHIYTTWRLLDALLCGALICPGGCRVSFICWHVHTEQWVTTDMSKEGQDGNEGPGPLTQLLGPNRPNHIEQTLHSKWKTKQREASVPGEHWHREKRRWPRRIIASYQVQLSFNCFTISISPSIFLYMKFVHVG